MAGTRCRRGSHAARWLNGGMSSDGHGSSPAAWTAVIIITLAFAVGTLALILGNWPMFWVGAALVVVGVVAGKVMQKMGLGAQRSAS